MIGLESVLRHERALACAGIAALVALAWSYVWQGAGMGMSALDMTALSLFPHRQQGLEGSMEAGWIVVITMWWVMMIAMMTPSATPLVLLYLRVLRSHSQGASLGLLPAMLLAGYLAVWLVFSVAAAALQKALEPTGLISEMMLWSRSALLSALVLGAAGLYQFTSLKRACLTQCRTPVRFLTEHWRPGWWGSFQLGMRHGLYCLGCCWALMALLFVGGIMNLVWIAALMVFVLIEKLLPAGPAFGKVSGVLLIAWAVATLLV